MNFVFDASAKVAEPVTYPALMRSTRGRDCVVLFTSRTHGMEMTSTGFSSPEGGWIAADDRREWVPFTGTITITVS